MSYIRFSPSGFIGSTKSRLIPSRFYIFAHTNGKLGFSIRKDKYSYKNFSKDVIHCLKDREARELIKIFQEYLTEKEEIRKENKIIKEKKDMAKKIWINDNSFPIEITLNSGTLK
jgi:hypothetical protein